MKTETQHKQLIDRYIEEIGYQLPRKQRSDIQEEIRSSILDMIDDRKEDEDIPDQEIVFQVLEEYGHPSTVAESYSTPKYLIGPRLFPIFTLVLKILAYLFVAGFVLSFAFTRGYVATIEAGTGERFLNLLLEFISSATNLFGGLVILFFILERVLSKDKLKAKQPEKKWQPSDLLKQQYSERVRPSKQIADIVICLGLIIWFNFFPQWVGGFYANDSGWNFVPLLSPEFKSFLPWITLRLALSIIFSIFLLKAGTWDWRTRWTEIGLNIFSIILLMSMVTGGPITGFTPEYLLAMKAKAIDSDLFQTVLPGMDIGINITIGMIAFGIAISTLKKFLEMVRRGEVLSIPLTK